MTKKWIGIFVAIIALGLVALLIVDGLNNRTGKRGANPYELEVDEYYEVDPDLILCKEVKQIRLGEEAQGIACQGENLYVLLGSKVQVISLKGQVESQFDIPIPGRCIHVSGETIYVGHQDFISQYYIDGRFIKSWDSPGPKTVITSVGTLDEYVFVADAGNRRVLKYDTHGFLLDSIKGKRSDKDTHGFIIPSGYFELATYQDELWIVNPGMHALENYTPDGRLRGYWDAPGMKVEDLTGCCNPAQMTIDDQGNFITAEKGVVRIKKYKASGEFVGVIAPPDKFPNGLHAPEVVVSPSNEIIALDFDQKLIRFFKYQ